MTVDATETEQLEKGGKIIFIIWFAMFISLGIYLLICEVVKYQFLAVSAVAMIYFKPRKDELMELADQMRYRS